jgi:large subunit ribosomal protein L6
MSRVGKKTIPLPAGVVFEYDAQTNIAKVTGPKGVLEAKLQPFVKIENNDNKLEVSVDKPDTKYQRAIWGTSRAVVANLVHGVSSGFNKEIELNGVGYKMELAKDLTIYIGFSHPVKITVPDKIKLNLNKNVLSGESIDKHLLGDFFTSLHNMKPCDPYKQKGFKFPGRMYRKKVGKKAK